MATLYEYWNATDTWNGSGNWGIKWNAQTFTPSISHIITSVKLKLMRNFDVGLGTVTVSIQGVDGNGKPDGTDLTSGTIDGDTISLYPISTWMEIFLTSYTLNALTQYAIVLKALESDGTPYLRWRGADGSYDGRAWYTSNGGSTWLSEGANSDYMFEEYGIPLIANADRGTVWVETTKTHWVDETQSEQSFEGTLVGAGSHPEGTYWAEGTYYHYIDEDGDERRQEGTLVGAGSNPEGTRWVEGAYLHYIDTSGDERYL